MEQDEDRGTSVHAAVRAFDARVDAAAAAAPPSKAWVRAAVRRQGASRPPVRLRRLTVDIVLRHGDLLAELFSAFPDDVQHVQPYDMTTGWQGGGAAPPLDPFTLLTTDARWTDEWGTGWAHAVGGTGEQCVGGAYQCEARVGVAVDVVVGDGRVDR